MCGGTHSAWKRAYSRIYYYVELLPVVYQRQIILTDRAFPVVAARLEYTSGYGVWQNFLNVPAPSTDSEHAVAQGVLRR